MTIITPKYICDVIATTPPNEKLFISVFKVGDGINFVSGKGETKYGSPRRHWTARLLKYEIGLAFGAEQVQIVAPVKTERGTPGCA